VTLANSLQSTQRYNPEGSHLHEKQLAFSAIHQNKAILDRENHENSMIACTVMVFSVIRNHENLDQEFRISHVGT
jgi:hypothetical protein